MKLKNQNALMASLMAAILGGGCVLTYKNLAAQAAQTTLTTDAVETVA